MDPYDQDHDDPLDGLANAADDANQPAPSRAALYNAAAGQGTPIDIDLNCIHCEYNLRGQLTTGRCSECGTAIAHSLRSDLLRFANVRWLKSLKQGVMWVIIATFVGIAMAIAAGIASVAIMTSQQPTFNPQTGAMIPPPTPISVTILTIVVTTIPGLMQCFGYWKLTAPEPPPMKPRTARAIARWFLLPGYGVSIVAACMTIVQVEAVLLASAGLDVVSGLATLVGLIAVMLYLRQLALRSQDRGLAKQTSIVLWGLTITMAGMLLGGGLLVAVFASSQTPSAASGAAGLTMILLCPAILALLVFAIWWIVLLFFYQARFARMINLAVKHQREARAATAV